MSQTASAAATLPSRTNGKLIDRSLSIIGLTSRPRVASASPAVTTSDRRASTTSAGAQALIRSAWSSISSLAVAFEDAGARALALRILGIVTAMAVVGAVLVGVVAAIVAPSASPLSMPRIDPVAGGMTVGVAFGFGLADMCIVALAAVAATAPRYRRRRVGGLAAYDVLAGVALMLWTVFVGSVGVAVGEVAGAYSLAPLSVQALMVDLPLLFAAIGSPVALLIACRGTEQTRSRAFRLLPLVLVAGAAALLLAAVIETNVSQGLLSGLVLGH